MSDIKLVLTDLDGTVVLPGEHEISEAVRQAVIDVENGGVTLTAVTGRPYEKAKNVLQLLGFTDLCVFDGGATIRRADTGELAWSKWLEPELLREIVGSVLPYCTEIDYFPEWRRLAKREVELSRVSEAAPYVFAFIDVNKQGEAEEALAKISDIDSHYSHGHSPGDGLVGIHITHREADKFHGVNALRRLVHSDKAHTLAIGDGNNDLPLFKNAGVKVAMGNATERLKSAADHIVAPVEQDGFAEAMRRFVLK